MLSVLAAVTVLPAILGAAPGVKPGQMIVYHGSIAERTPDATAGERREKTFDLTWLVTEADEKGAKLYWLVEERGRGAWPWPDRFGQLVLDAKRQPQGADAPSLLYDYASGESPVPLPSPIVAFDAPLAAGAKWTQSGHEHEVLADRKFDGRDAWEVQLRNRYGLRRTLLVAKDAPLLVSLAERVFMNMGTEYELAMKLDGVEELTDAQRAATEEAFSGLVALRAKLQRPRLSPDTAWNAEQLALLSTVLPGLEKRAAGGLLSRLVESAARDAKLQTGRADEVAQLLARYVGQPVESFSVAGLDGGKLTAADLAGRVTVLHFWDYRNEPLKEPYGQVGYLEFLHQKRKDQGVKVYGVAVDGRLAEGGAERRAALSGVRKLKAFMNLSYPLVLDAGDFVKALGDPRLVGATLPLFVVVGRDGKIAHYHVGFYEVDRQVGLKDLDAAVAAALEKK
ncbi:MAG: TlpA family protein disulfide reductase [Planctomycetia bacterium]|nr:TlpA family protein disulfide reductase [Planctomycetia bacterium]